MLFIIVDTRQAYLMWLDWRWHTLNELVSYFVKNGDDWVITSASHSPKTQTVTILNLRLALILTEDSNHPIPFVQTRLCMHVHPSVQITNTKLWLAAVSFSIFYFESDYALLFQTPNQAFHPTVCLNVSGPFNLTRHCQMEPNALAALSLAASA